MTHSTPPARRLALLAGLLTVALISCGREITGPGTSTVNAFKRFASFAFSPQYETAVPSTALQAALTQVAFERVRITLRREDGTIALDTVVSFPAGADSLTLSLIVPLAASAPASGVPLTLNLGYVNAAGDTVFKGGPIPVTVTPSTGGAPPAPVQVPVHYTGTGSNATAVTISPKSVSGIAGGVTTFSATVTGPTGAAIPGTPLVFTSSNPAVVSIPNPSLGAATFVGRGTAKAYVQLLTGQIDSATVTVILPASQLSLTSGSSQTAPAGTNVPLPIIAKVAASDGIGVAGVTVSFAVVSGGGSVTPSSAVSGADGSVSAAWKLGTTVGAQSMTVSAAGLSGSPLTVNATALSVTPTKLSITSQPSGAKTGASLGTVTVTALTADGTTATTFAGDVSVALGANPGAGTLSGTTTVQAVNGIATFAGLSLNKPASGYTLAFSSSGLTSATSSAFEVTVGPATRLSIGSMPLYATAGASVTPPVVVTVMDSAGNTVPTFTGAITMALGVNPKSGTLAGTVTRNAVAGVATFNDLRINQAAPGYTLAATSPTLTTGTSAAFTVLPDAPAEVQVVRGDAQTKPAGSTLDTIVVRVVDAFGNGVAGRPVAFAVATGGGTVTSPSATTNADGEGRALWTIGSGAQTLTATSGTLAPLTLTATATAPPGGTATQLVITRQPRTSSASGALDTVIVTAKDSSGSVAASFTGTVAMGIVSGPVGASVIGPTSLNAVAGIASFNGIAFDKVGSYMLRFASSGLSNATTGFVTVTAGPAKNIVADSGVNQTGPTSQALPIPLVARITDQYGNKVTGASVSWAVASGGGTLSPTTTVSDTGGRVRAQWTLGGTVGTQSVTVSSTGLTGSPLTYTATATAVASAYASVGVGGSWDNPASWSPAGIPGILDDVTIGLSTSIVLTATAAVHTLNITGGTLDLGANELKIGGNVAAASATINGTGKLSMTGGGARTLFLAQVSNLYVDTSTVVSLGSNVNVTGNVAGTGNVSVAGQLWPNGHTLTVSNTNALSYGSQLSILPTGNLKMTLPADSVLAFNADFGGVASDTSLTAGFLRLDNSFSQSGDAKSFAPTGTHVTSLKATAFNNALRAITETAVPTRTRRSMAFNLLQFANPGYTASHFNILRLDQNNFSVDLGSNVYANRVVTGDTLRTRTVSGSGSTLFMKDGSLVNLSFSGALLQVDSAVTTTQLDSVSFYAQAVTADQITLNLTSGATPTLTNLSFGAAPTTGRYLVVNGAGTATMGNPNPGAHGGFVGTTGGAAISGWIASRNMTAATSGDWSTPATWSPAGLPSMHDTVTIATGATVQLTGGGSVKHMVMAAGAGLNIQSFQTLNVYGNWTSDTTSSVTSGGYATYTNFWGDALVRGRLWGASVNKNMTLVGRTIFDGDVSVGDQASYNPVVLDINGQVATTNLYFSTMTGGRLKMTDPAGVLNLQYGGTFNGASTDGLLTNGVINLKGTFGASGVSFSATGSHVTNFVGITSIDFQGQGGFGSTLGHFATVTNTLPFAQGAIMLQSDVWAEGNLNSAPATSDSVRFLSTVPHTFHARGFSTTSVSAATRTVFDGVAVDLADGGSMASTVYGLSFRNLAGMTAFKLTRSVTPAITFNGWAFQYLSVGTPTKFIDATSTVSPMTITMTGQTPSLAQLTANSLVLSNFLVTSNASVTWP